MLRLRLAAPVAAMVIAVGLGSACGYSDPTATTGAPMAGLATLTPTPSPSPSVGASPDASPTPDANPDKFTDGDGKPVVTLPDGLQYIDIVVGTGAAPSSLSDNVSVHYTGWLKATGTLFDTSRKTAGAAPAPFALNAVVPGFGEGILSMKVGGKRKLIIPSALGYGKTGSGSVIPPNSDLVFEVELMSVTAPSPSPAASAAPAPSSSP